MHEAGSPESWFESRIASAFPADRAAISAVRSVVLEAFRDASAAPRHIPSAGLHMRPNRRWLLGAAVAAALLVGSVGLAAAADGPGQPFYSLRLTLEAMTLPPVGSAGRPAAQLRMLESRLAEVQQAGVAGNPDAADAALQAMEVTLADIAADPSAASGDPATMTQGLDNAATVLTGLVDKLPRASIPGLERAIDRVHHVRGARTGPGPAVPGTAATPGGSPVPGYLRVGDRSDVSGASGAAAPARIPGVLRSGNPTERGRPARSAADSGNDAAGNAGDIAGGSGRGAQNGGGGSHTGSGGNAASGANAGNNGKSASGPSTPARGANKNPHPRRPGKHGAGASGSRPGSSVVASRPGPG